MNPRDVLSELDRLEVTIFYQQLGPDQDPDTRIDVGHGRERVYPELANAIEEHTPTLLKIARFEPSRSAAGVYYRRPGGSA